MDRRGFIRSALYFTVVSAGGPLAGCHRNHEDDPPLPDEHPLPPMGSEPFPQGVASGDPRESSIVFWTRCPSTNGAAVPLRLEVSSSDSFSSLAASVELSATPTYDYTVRAKVTNLAPATPYFYRFVAGRIASPVGAARTAPAASSAPQQLRFAWLSCQDWSTNHWAAFSLLAREELDFVVHVGDYIYESVDLAFAPGRAEAAHTRIVLPNGDTHGGLSPGIHATSLEDYRTLYRTYRGDPRLQEVHRRFAVIAIWDDHEFADDSWQDHETYNNSNLRDTGRRRAANQAWAEYMPVDWGDVSFDLSNPSFANIRIFRDFRFGSLMHLVMTDERLHRDDHVVSEMAIATLAGHDREHGDDRIGSRFFVPHSVLEDFERYDDLTLGRKPTILGEAQTDWWKATMKGATARWKVWGNEVTLNRMWLDLRNLAPSPFNRQYVLNADVWDGYPSHRGDLMGFLKAEGIRDVVAITGDLHAFQCGVVRDHPDPAIGTPVAVDFVSAGVSSPSFYDYVRQGTTGTPLAALAAVPQGFDALMREQNPDLKYADHNAQGYAVATVTADKFTVVYHKVKRLNPDGSVPLNPLAK
ncbi:MAG TPA: alkaline phosphatase D family protein, partial [Telluria sp.]|nr:alkaline phosphatase D family protein [Telluria sp.]